MPCSCICAKCSGLSRRPRMPPWICGTSVLTRPSRISGKPVCADTSVTATAASRNAWADPPVDRISTPRAVSACAKGTKPDLSETEIRARRMGTISVMAAPDVSYAGGIDLEAEQVQRPADNPAFVVKIECPHAPRPAHSGAQHGVDGKPGEGARQRQQLHRRDAQHGPVVHDLLARAAD